MSESCKTCVFYKPGNNTEEPGACHRYPPVLHFVPVQANQKVQIQNQQSVEMQPVSFWPLVIETTWCGEYDGDPALEMTSKGVN